MVFTRKKRQVNRRLFRQLDDFDQDSIIGNTMSVRQENTTINEGYVVQELIVGNSDSNPTANKILVNVKTLGRCFIEKIGEEKGEMGNIVDAVENKIHNAVLNAIDSNITPIDNKLKFN